MSANAHLKPEDPHQDAAVPLACRETRQGNLRIATPPGLTGMKHALNRDPASMHDKSFQEPGRYHCFFSDLQIGKQGVNWSTLRNCTPPPPSVTELREQ